MSLKVPKATGPDLFKPGYKVSFRSGMLLRSSEVAARRCWE